MATAAAATMATTGSPALLSALEFLPLFRPLLFPGTFPGVAAASVADSVSSADVLSLLLFLSLALTPGSVGTVVASVGAAFTVILALPLETVMVPLIAADMFGEKDFSKMVGIFVSVNTAGYAFGTPVANLIFDGCGTYKPMLLLTALMMLLIAVSFWFIINTAGKLRVQIVSAENERMIQ